MTMPKIPAPNGATRVFATIGDPVVQVQAPHLMNEVFARAGSNAVMVPIEISSAHVGALIEALKSVGNFDGLLATIPHKFELLGHADKIGAVAQAAGCGNALRRESDGTWSAENFDGIGFVTGMMKAGHAVAGKMVSVYGAGGAGSSIAAALLDAGALVVRVTDLSSGRVDELAQRLDSRWPGRARGMSAGEHLDSDIVVNATPVGLSARDQLPFTLAGLNPDAVVAEIIMKPTETRLLKEARALGFHTQPGFEMLAPQIELYRQFFRVPGPYMPDSPAAAVEVSNRDL